MDLESPWNVNVRFPHHIGKQQCMPHVFWNLSQPLIIVLFPNNNMMSCFPDPMSAFKLAKHQNQIFYVSFCNNDLFYMQILILDIWIVCLCGGTCLATKPMSSSLSASSRTSTSRVFIRMDRSRPSAFLRNMSSKRPGVAITILPLDTGNRERDEYLQ